MTGERAFETVDRAMHRATRARLRNIEADMVAMSVRALEAPKIGSGLQAGISAVEVGACALRKVLQAEFSGLPAEGGLRLMSKRPKQG